MSQLKFIEELKNQWMATVDALADPLLIIDHHYRIHKTNKTLADAVKKNIKNVIGKKCHEVFAGRSKPCAGCKAKNVFAGKKTEPYELAMGDKIYEISAQKFVEDKNEYVLHLYRDITEKKKLFEQLTHAEKLASIGTLAGGFAHEINNPLGGILVFSQMLLREMDKKSSHFQDVVEIEAAAQRCKKIVEDLLSFARQKPAQRVRMNTDVHQALQKALEFARVGFKECQAEFEMNLDAKNCTVFSDEQRLIQIFLNLFKNALQAMPDGGILRVETKNDKRNLTITVSDTGTGISKQHLAKIFDPFFTTKQPGEGTGLGLSVVYGLVRDDEGTIQATSKVGQGSKMTVKFPLFIK